MGIAGIILSGAIGFFLWLMILVVLCAVVRSLKAILLVTIAVGVISLMAAALIYISEPSKTSPSRGGLLA
jgi:DMSO reductase anchor subunit